MGHEGDGDANSNWDARNNPKRISNGTGRLGNKRTNEYHPDYNIIKIGLNIEKSPGHLGRFTGENDQLTLM